MFYIICILRAWNKNNMLHFFIDKEKKEIERDGENKIRNERKKDREKIAKKVFFEFSCRKLDAPPKKGFSITLLFA